MPAACSNPPGFDRSHHGPNEPVKVAAHIGYPSVGEGCPAVLAPGGLNMSGSNDTTGAGWTLGGGVEYDVTQHVTIGVDYIYFDLGSQTVTVTPNPIGAFPGTAIAMNQHFTGNILRAVLNVKFP
jgi:opacity protein-like surface antigen